MKKEDIISIVNKHRNKFFWKGSYTEDLHLLDLILVENSYTEGNYALTLDNQNVHLAQSSSALNQKIEETASKLGIHYKKGTTLCSEVFDSYMVDASQLMGRVPKDISLIGAEMEAFALFYNAKLLGKQASCLLTVADDHFHGGIVTAEEREKSLDNMIVLALDAIIK